jgi:hypothetical protein
VVTENNETVVHEADGDNETVTQMTDETEEKSTDVAEVHDNVRSITEKYHEVDSKSADTVTLMKEQVNDPTLTKYFDMVRRGNKHFFSFAMGYCPDAARSMATRLNSFVCRRDGSKLL